MALQPVAPILSVVTSYGFTITRDVDANPAPPTTFYAYKVSYNAIVKYVNGSGGLQDALVWLPLGTITVVTAIPGTLNSVSLIAADDVSGLNASLEGPSAQATTLAATPVASGFTNVFSTQLTANWLANGNPTGTLYEAQLSTDATFLTGVVSSGFVSTLGFMFGTLLPTTPYYVRVRAQNSALINTNFVSLGSTVTGVGPDTVKVIRVYNLLVNRGYLITWSPNQELNITGYQVLRSPSPTDDASYQVVGTVAPPITSFLDKVAYSFGITWYWKVIAIDSGGNQSPFDTTIPAHEQTFHSFEEQPFPTSINASDFVTDEVPTGSIDSVNSLYLTAFPYRPKSVEIFLNGVKMIPGVDFNEGPLSQQITFTDPPDTGGIIRVNYKRFGL